MALKVYNTLSRKKELFKPLHGKKVNMFVCGPTVYDYSHLGHAKTYTQFDFIVRYLRFIGFEVNYLQNITDIDDKIISKAKDEGLDSHAIAIKFENIYKEDMLSLHNTSVTKYAKATDHIEQIVAQVKSLISKGYAYKISDGYYFNLKKFKNYGKLSGRNKLEENDSVSRIDDHPEKKNKGDFCLWKFYKEGEPFWETEIGKGRPGWHIEDTAITESHFGQQYDLHGGAVDLIFPHHEAEIAQQEASSGKEPFVKYWMHTAFLNINSEKMSKSKNNFFTIRDALKNYDYKVIRFFFISNHYRTQIDFSGEVLEQAKNGLQRLTDFTASIREDYDDKDNVEIISAFTEDFYSSIDDDFNTPKAFAALFDFVKEINTRKNAGSRVHSLMLEIDGLFDFLFSSVHVSDEILQLVEKRENARKNKDFKLSDDIRKKILNKGYAVEDTPHGPRVKPI